MKKHHLLLSAALAFASQPEAQADATIGASVFGSILQIHSSSQMAGAVDSLTWLGKEFIDRHDHGRELQSASSFDGLGECFNPTEAGSEHDGAGPTSTSRLLGIRASGNVLETTTQMAFWTQAGEAYPQGCAGNPDLKIAQNTSNLSNHTLSKKVTIGYQGIENAIQYLVTFHVPDTHAIATFEFLTGYMPREFHSFFTYEPKSRALASIDAGPGEQNLPLIFATEDRSFAMGVYSPDLPQKGTEFASAGYGRFDFPQQKTSKWNVVSRKRGVTPGDYSFTAYLVVGSLDQVMQGLTAVYQSLQTPAPVPTPAVAKQKVYRFYHSSTGEHFLTLNYSEGVTAGYSYDGVGFIVLANPDAAAGTTPLYRCLSEGKHFVSGSAGCEGGSREGLYGYAYSSPVPGSVPLYRYYNRANGDHLTTSNRSEAEQAGYQLDGPQGYVPASF